MRSFRSSAIVFSLIIGVCLTGPGAVAGAGSTTDPLLLAQAAAPVSADEAAALVVATSGGRILGVRLDDKARPGVYHVKVLLAGGRVRVYLVDAGSGRILR